MDGKENKSKECTKVEMQVIFNRELCQKSG